MKTKQKYQICSRCIMDTSDPDIVFDEDGVCNHCRNFDINIRKQWLPNDEGKVRLQAIVDKIKKDGAGKQYDCILGLSGGVDSSYLALIAKKMGLRPLGVHVDTGWNRDVGMSNIESIVKVLNIDLFTQVIDWEEMRDLQVAYLKSGVENQDTPQDHVIFAALYRFAMDNRIRFVLSGSNYATESVLPTAWGHDAMDLRQLKAIHKLYGTKKLKTYPTVNFFKYRFYYPYIKKMQVVDILNYIPYDRENAIQTLQKEVGFKDYGKKHYESQFTKFFQGYFLPVKFGYDKRKAHFSSLILSGQMTREEALNKIEEKTYSDETLKSDRDFIIKKLGLSQESFSEIMAAPNKSFVDYPTSEKLRITLSKIKEMIRRLIRRGKWRMAI
ncbi:MAG: N-acetyl sugar amidotransferase [Bacteroidales bacterium]